MPSENLFPNGTMAMINEIGNHTHEPRRPESRERLLTRLKPTLRVLQIFGYFPGTLDMIKNQNNRGYQLCTSDNDFFRNRKAYSGCTNTALVSYTIATVVVNLSIIAFNIYTSQGLIMQLGLLHAVTTSVIITGFKPLVNFVQLIIFWLKFKHHKNVLLKMQELDDMLFDLTGKHTTVVRSVNRMMVATATISFVLALVLRVFDIAYKGEQLFGNVISALSPILVPLLTVWSLVPLVYFVILTKLVRSWCKMLRAAIRRDNHLQKRDLSEYFMYFKRLTAMLTDFGPLFNSFIAFSLTWSVVTVCLAIYFITQAKVLVEVPEGLEKNPEALRMYLEIVYINLGWSFIQILIAFLFICAISTAGFRTNEEASEIMDDILSVNPFDDSKCDSTVINCLTFHMSQIHAWGISIMRAFPIQRSTLLTMISLILTYGMVLVKLRTDQDIRDKNNNQTQEWDRKSIYE